MNIFKKTPPKLPDDQLKLKGKITRIGVMTSSYDLTRVVAYIVILEGNPPVIFSVPPEFEEFSACTQAGDVVELDLEGPGIYGYWKLTGITNKCLGDPAIFRASISRPQRTAA